jgi:hypothetical protein
MFFFIIYKGSGIITPLCLVLGAVIPLIFMEPGTPAFRGVTFLIAAVLNYIVAQNNPGSLYFINVKVWTLIFLGMAIYMGFIYS